MLLGVIFVLIIVSIYETIRFFRNEKRGWKVYKKSRHIIIYAEKINGSWQRIDVDAKIDIGTFIPCFKDEKEWESYPEWAQNRNVIMDRIKEKFPLKD